MANTMRWRYGDTNPVVLPVASAVEVEIGDLVYLESSTGAARPASDVTDQGSALLTQLAFQDGFVGVAMQASPSGEAGSIRVATSGVFELDCDAATWSLGEAVTPATNGAGDQLLDQKVEAASSLTAAIGRCAKAAPTNTTRVLADLVSVVMRGGPQAAES